MFLVVMALLIDRVFCASAFGSDQTSLEPPAAFLPTCFAASALADWLELLPLAQAETPKASGKASSNAAPLLTAVRLPDLAPPEPLERLETLNLYPFLYVVALRSRLVTE